MEGSLLAQREVLSLGIVSAVCAALVVFGGAARTVAAAEGVAGELPLGHPGFRPSPKRPYGWRGDGSGVFPGAVDPPKPWDIATGENVLWRTKIRTGTLPVGTQSSPVIVGDKIFVLSEMSNLVCLDKWTGRILWLRENEGEVLGGKGVLKRIYGSSVSAGYGWTTPTPVSDGRRVYCSFGHGVVCAYDLDGKLQWASRFDFRGGVSQSPCLCASADGAGPDVLVTSSDGADAFIGWDAATGKRLWTIPVLRRSGGENSKGGIIGKGAVITVWVDSRSYALTSDGVLIDPRAGKIVQNVKPLPFARDHMSPIVRQGAAFFYHARERKFLAVKLTPGSDSEPLWECEAGKAKFYRSPVLVGEEVLLVPPGGKLGPPGGKPWLLNAKTGQSRELDIPLSGNWMSPVFGGGYVYYLLSRGRMLVYQPSADWKQVADFNPAFVGFKTVNGELPNGPVLEGTRLYYRDCAALLCADSRVGGPDDERVAKAAKSGAAAVPELTKLCGLRDRLVAVQAAKALGRIGREAGPATRAIVALLADPQTGKQGEAAFAAAKAVAGDLVAALAGHATDDDASVRCGAWNGLARLKAVPADDVIRAGLAESDARVKGAVVAAMVEMGSGETPPANLLERVNAAAADQRSGVRAAALEVLNGIGKGANVAAVKRGLADRDEQVRMQAVRGLVIAWPAAPLPEKLDERFWRAMRDVLADRWMGPRDELSGRLAAKVLPEIGEPALPMLTGIFEDEDNFDVPLHHRASEALAAMWPKSKPAIPAYRKAVEKMKGNGDWRFLRRGFGAVVSGDGDKEKGEESDE